MRSHGTVATDSKVFDLSILTWSRLSANAASGSKLKAASASSAVATRGTPAGASVEAAEAAPTGRCWISAEATTGVPPATELPE